MTKEQRINRPCKYCGKDLPGEHMRRKFCSQRCCSLWHYKNNPKFHNHRIKYSEEYHKKHKDKKSYKIKKKQQFKRWLDKNREHFNDLVREPNKIRRRKNYRKWKRAGLCTICGRKRDLDVLYCSKCRKIQIDSYNRWSAKQNDKRIMAMD